MRAVMHILFPACRLLLACAFALTASTATSDAVAAEASRPYSIVVDGKLGLIDEDGTVVVEPQFTYHDTNVVGFCPPEGPRHFWWHDGMAIVWKDDKAGYVNSRGELAVEPQFEKAGMFYGGCAFASKPIARIVMINKQGRVLHSGLEEVRRPKDGVAVVKKLGLWGLLNVESGEFIVNPVYEEVSGTGPYIEVSRNRRWGIIDLAGKTVLPFENDFVRIINDLAVVGRDHKSGIFDLEQRKLTAPIKFDAIGVFSGGLFEFIEDRKSGFIDKNGKVMVAPEYDTVYRFHGEQAWGLKGTQHYLFDRSGLVIASPDVDGISDQGDDYTIVYREVGSERDRVRRKCAVVDSHGKFIVPFKYRSIGEFSNGRAIVWLDGKAGVIDEAGKEILAPSFASISSFSNGLAIAARQVAPIQRRVLRTDPHWKVGLIGRDGRWVCEPKYRGLSPERNGFRVAEIDSEDTPPREYIGYTDAEGNLLFSSQDWFMGEPFGGALASVLTSEGQAYVNREGKVVWSWLRHVRVRGSRK